MKGGYNGVRERRDEGCPSCGTSYDRYVPADDDYEPEEGYTIGRVCPVVNFGNYARGGYIHFERNLEPVVEAESRKSTARQ